MATKRKARRMAESTVARPAPCRARARPKAVRFVWRHLTLSVTHTPDYLSPGWSHVELRVVTPKGAPCPITDTGYRSHFLDAELLAASGGPVAFFIAWMDRDASTKAWACTEARWRQLELFPR